MRPIGFSHPTLSRRTALQAGAIGLLGLGAGDLAALRALGNTRAKPKACLFIFLSGGLGQHDSFDMKPDAPAEIRGEFKPIATRTPGIQIVEHLPRLAERSRHWALVRSLGHDSNEHQTAHLYLLTGRSVTPPGFNRNIPQPTDWPSMTSIVGQMLRPRNNLPPVVVLPERIVQNNGRIVPGQFGGLMGRHRDPWFVEASPYDARAYGAFPDFEFDHQERPLSEQRRVWRMPSLTLPHSVGSERIENRMSLLRQLDAQRADLDRAGNSGRFDKFHQNAVSLLMQRQVREAFDVTSAELKTLERYGRNSFGYSLLMAKRLVAAGVSLVQVNLGNHETWDTHGNAFPHLKDKLYPPTDRAASALLDDLESEGLLDSTLVVMAGEFGRTPKISLLPKEYKLPGRDHWGAVQTVWFAGGGVKGGTVIGGTDRIGAYATSSPQTPESFAATIYQTLGIPRTAHWHDAEDRPHAVYHGEPIAGLVG